MSMHAPIPNDDKAKQYIDSIIELNRQYGMDGHVSEETYNRAVHAAESSVSGLQHRS